MSTKPLLLPSLLSSNNLPVPPKSPGMLKRRASSDAASTLRTPSILSTATKQSAIKVLQKSKQNKENKDVFISSNTISLKSGKPTKTTGENGISTEVLAAKISGMELAGQAKDLKISKLSEQLKEIKKSLDTLSSRKIIESFPVPPPIVEKEEQRWMSKEEGKAMRDEIQSLKSLLTSHTQQFHANCTQINLAQALSEEVSRRIVAEAKVEKLEKELKELKVVAVEARRDDESSRKGDVVEGKEGVEERGKRGKADSDAEGKDVGAVSNILGQVDSSLTSDSTPSNKSTTNDPTRPSQPPIQVQPLFTHSQVIPSNTHNRKRSSSTSTSTSTFGHIRQGSTSSTFTSSLAALDENTVTPRYTRMNAQSEKIRIWNDKAKDRTAPVLPGIIPASPFVVHLPKDSSGSSNGRSGRIGGGGERNVR